MTRSRIAALGLIAALAVAGCGKSPEDKARDNGKAVGKAVRELHDAGSVDQARAAVKDLRTAAADIGDDARAAVKDQVDTQKATLSAAASSLTSADSAGLKNSIQDVRAQADAFRHSDDSVANEFWRGFEEGYDG